MTKSSSNTMQNVAMFEQRKRDHIQLALDDANEAFGTSGLAGIRLRHEAIPDLDFNQITLQTTRLGQSVPKPFLVSSMTAGHTQAASINQTLAAACSEQQWAMGVGSQRRQLFDPNAAQEWIELRRYFPDIELYANIGLAQVIQEEPHVLGELVTSIQAKALIIHCNALQECLQPEGTTDFQGSFDAIQRVCQTLPCPIILKETGCGFSEKTLSKLIGSGVTAVDVSGLGGTHWGRIEGKRAHNHDDWRADAAMTFSHWGIPTVESLLYASALKPDYEIWASGGVRSGLDAAKLFALGATTVGFAKPMLESALKGVNAVVSHMKQIENELRVAMFCTDSLNLALLQEDKVCR